MDYKIPEDILSRIPEYFYAAFAGELVSVFGADILTKSEEDDIYVLSYHSGTNGWNVALKTTCTKLDMNWLYQYYDRLDWRESDMFDGEIEELIVSKFIENSDVGGPSAYYLWLFNKNKQEDECL